jgi:hypothetical protein
VDLDSFYISDKRVHIIIFMGDNSNNNNNNYVLEVRETYALLIKDAPTTQFHFSQCHSDRSVIILLQCQPIHRRTTLDDARGGSFRQII